MIFTVKLRVIGVVSLYQYLMTELLLLLVVIKTMVIVETQRIIAVTFEFINI